MTSLQRQMQLIYFTKASLLFNIFPTNSTHFSQFFTGLRTRPLYKSECCLRSRSRTEISTSSLLWNQHPSNRRFSSPNISSSAAAMSTSVLDVLAWPMSFRTFSISLHQFLTKCALITSQAYNSLNRLWISMKATCFAYTNRTFSRNQVSMSLPLRINIFPAQHLTHPCIVYCM
jgi:hypothetical protein